MPHMAQNLIAFAIAVSANAAGLTRGSIARQFLRRVIRGLLRVGFGGQTLRRLQRRGNRIRTGLGTPHFGLQLAEQFVHLGVVRPGRLKA